MKNAKTSASRRFQLTSLEQLNIDIVTLWKELAGRRFHLSLPKSPLTEATLDDILNHEGDDPLEIICVKPKGFSKFTPDEAIQYAKMPLISLAAIGVSKQFQFFESVALHMLDKEKLEKESEYLSTDLRRRIKCLDMDQSVEYTMRELISPILIGAMMLSADDHLKLICEQNIEGTRGNGPVDYVISFKSINIVLTEAKKEKVDVGVAQNIAQQVANREQLARKLFNVVGMKRNYDDLLSEISEVPTYGIITTGDEWLFTRYCGIDIIKSEKLTLDIKEGVDHESREDHDSRRKRDLVVLLHWLVGIMKTQIGNVNLFPELLSLK